MLDFMWHYSHFSAKFLECLDINVSPTLVGISPSIIMCLIPVSFVFQNPKGFTIDLLDHLGSQAQVGMVSLLMLRTLL